MAKISKPIFPVSDGIWGSSLGAADMKKPNATDFNDPQWTWSYAWKKAGDNPPPRQFFNFLQNQFDWGIKYILQEGIPEWDNAAEYWNGAVVQDPANGYYYRNHWTASSTVGGNNPYNNPDRWEQIAFTQGQIQAWRTIPAGVIMYYAQDGYPAGWLPCNGAAVSRTAYVDLYNTIGTRYGGGDGSTTFNLPNVGTRFIRGSYGLSTGQLQSYAQRDVYGNFVMARDEDNIDLADNTNGAFAITSYQKLGGGFQSNSEGGDYALTNFYASRIVPTDSEVRPNAIAFPAIIKY